MLALGFPFTLSHLIFITHSLHHSIHLYTYIHLRQLLIPTVTHHSAVWPAKVVQKLKMGQSFASIHCIADICDCQNVPVKLLFVYMCPFSGDLSIFSVRISSFFSYFCVIHTSVLSLSTWLYNNLNIYRLLEICTVHVIKSG
jgi:hypothetical protein